jgi:hypothetical protein
MVTCSIAARAQVSLRISADVSSSKACSVLLGDLSEALCGQVAQGTLPKIYSSGVHPKAFTERKPKREVHRQVVNG